jgi:hypothetical protein
MLGHEGPLVFSEHPAQNEEAFNSLVQLQRFADAALLPAHGEPWTQPGSVGRAIDGARVV